MAVLKIQPPSEKQKEFLLARTKHIGFGGARGGGKSWAVRTKAKLMCIKYPGIRVLIVRRTYPELQNNHINILKSELYGIASYVDKDKQLRFYNGSVIDFSYCAADSDLDRLQGVEYDVIFLDEATQLSEYQMRAIVACMRGVNSFPKRVYYTCNPGGKGHAYIKRIFIDRDYAPGEGGKDYTFIRSLVTDNKALMEAQPEYIKQLEALPFDLRRAWLEGDWDALAGQYFDEFRRDIHVCEPFEIPPWWRRYRAFDYGLDMLAVLWAAVSDSGQIYIYRELKAPNLIVSDAAARVLEMTGDESIQCTYAPPDIKNRQKDTGKSMADMFAESGLRLTFAKAERSSGWMRVKELLKPLRSPSGEGKTAKLQIFSTCGELIHDLPLLMHSEHDPSDCATEPHDITHICDALRYLCTGTLRPGSEKKLLTDEERWKKILIRRSGKEKK